MEVQAQPAPPQAQASQQIDDILFTDVEAPSPFDPDGLQGVTFDEEVPSLIDPITPEKMPEPEFASFVPGPAVAASPTPSSEGSSLMNDHRENEEFTNASKFSLLYYRQFFHVDTDDVKLRIMKSIMPMSDGFLEAVAPNPDLYGPIWITSTLIFAVGAAGNFASYLSHDVAEIPVDGIGDDFANLDTATILPGWSYDFRKLTQASVMIWGYTSLVPLGLYMFLWFYAESTIDLLLLVCLWGYSLSIFIPTAVLCIINIELLRWLFVMSAFASSASVIVSNLQCRIQDRLPEGNKAKIVLAVLVGIHLLISLAFKVYFFEY